MSWNKDGQNSEPKVYTCFDQEIRFRLTNPIHAVDLKSIGIQLLCKVAVSPAVNAAQMYS